MLGSAIVVALAAGAWRAGITTSSDHKRIVATANVLGDLRRAVSAPAGFLGTVGANPGTLSQLTRPIWNSRTEVTSVPTNSCGQRFTDAQVANWDKGGPFVEFFIPGSGLRTPIGVVSDTLRRVPSAPAAGVLEVVIRNVSERDARLLDESVDGGNGPAAGTIRWAPSAGGATLSYAMPIDDDC